MPYSNRKPINPVSITDIFRYNSWDINGVILTREHTKRPKKDLFFSSKRLAKHNLIHIYFPRFFADQR